MIESKYWKEDLLNHAKRLGAVKNPKRWSEKLVVNFEKEIMISFFCIRKLIEAYKVSDSTKKHKAGIFSYAPSGRKVTKLNHISIDEIYNLETEIKIEKDIEFIANQLIHSLTMFSFRDENRNWDCILVCSDYECRKTIYRIPISIIISILRLVGNDYPNSYSMELNEKPDDYDIQVN